MFDPAQIHLIQTGQIVPYNVFLSLVGHISMLIAKISKYKLVCSFQDTAWYQDIAWYKMPFSINNTLQLLLQLCF